MNDAETLAAIRERDAAWHVGFREDGDLNLRAHPETECSADRDRHTLLALRDAEAARHREVVAALEGIAPGPYRYEGPRDQGGMARVWGRQGTPPDFSDGWAIPLVAMGTAPQLEYLCRLLNAARGVLAADEEAGRP